MVKQEKTYVINGLMQGPLPSHDFVIEDAVVKAHSVKQAKFRLAQRMAQEKGISSKILYGRMKMLKVQEI